VNSVATHVGAQQVFGRLLRLAVPDAERRSDILDAALGSSGKVEVPADPDELLDFVRRHVVPGLTKEVGSSLAETVVGDLVSEIRGCATQSGRGAPTLAMPVVTPRDEGPPRSGAFGSGPRRVQVALHASREAPPPSGEQIARRMVFVVHRDRVLRAAVARALLGARFDVDAVDDVAALVPLLRPELGMVVIVLDVGATKLEVLRSLVETHDPFVVAIAVKPDEATKTLADSGVGRYVVVPRQAAPAEIAERARELTLDPDGRG
jgi:hypothetical protein